MATGTVGATFACPLQTLDVVTGCRVLGDRHEKRFAAWEACDEHPKFLATLGPVGHLRPTQGAIGYVQAQAKKSSYRELEPEKRRSFAEEQAITVVLEPAGALHVIEIFLPGI
jgi:hypothetical protein